MRKKILLAAVIGLMGLSLVACGDDGKEKKENGKASESVENTVSADTPAPVTDSVISTEQNEKQQTTVIPDADIDANTDTAGDEDCFIWDGTAITDLTDKGKKIDELIIPDKCTRITNTGRFRDGKFTRLVIPDSVTDIDKRAFMWCSSLKDVTVGSGIAVYDDWFQSCENIEKITFSEGLTVLAGLHCDKLDSLTIPASVTEVGSESSWLNRYDSIVSTSDKYVVADSLEVFAPGDNIVTFFGFPRDYYFDIRKYMGVDEDYEITPEDEEKYDYFMKRTCQGAYNTSTNAERVSGYKPSGDEYISITLHCKKGSIWDVTAAYCDWVTVVYDSGNNAGGNNGSGTENAKPDDEPSDNGTSIGNVSDLLGIDADAIKTYYDMADSTVSRYVTLNDSKWMSLCVNNGTMAFTADDGRVYMIDLASGSSVSYDLYVGKDSHDSYVTIATNGGYIYLRDADDSAKPVVFDVSKKQKTVIDDKEIVDSFSTVCCYKDNVLFAGIKDGDYGIFVCDKQCKLQKFVSIRPADDVVEGGIVTDGSNLVLYMRMSKKDYAIVTLDTATFDSLNAFMISDTGIFDYFPDFKFESISLAGNTLLISDYQQLDGYYYAAVDCNGPVKNTMFKSKEKIASFQIGGTLRYVGQKGSWKRIDSDSSVVEEKADPYLVYSSYCLSDSMFLDKEHEQWYISDFNAENKIFIIK